MFCPIRRKDLYIPELSNRDEHSGDQNTNYRVPHTRQEEMISSAAVAFVDIANIAPAGPALPITWPELRNSPYFINEQFR